MKPLIVIALLLFGGGGAARAATADELLCPDALALGPNLITDIYWDGVFPIVIAGARMGGGDVPEGAAAGPLCLCDDPAGLPQPGFLVSMWEPARLVELVRTPGCMASLGGITMPGVDQKRRGIRGGRLPDNGVKAYYHFHLYAYPLLNMLGLLVEENCVGDSYVDFDVMYFSELDPTWMYDELSFLTAPEAALVSGLVAQSACIADAAAANLDEPIDDLFWCAGSWGRIYPMVGNHVGPRSVPTTTSLLAARGMAAMHRRGLAWRTMGNDAVCRAKIEPFFVKSQYRLSMFYPVPEATGYHAVGAATFSWGEWRTIPGTGEDTSYVVWRWKDCCVGF